MMFYTCAPVAKIIKKSDEKIIENRCKILSKSGFGGSWKSCCEKVWKIFPKSAPRGPQRSSKSNQNPLQDPLGTLLGPTLVLQIWAGVSRGGPRRLQGVPGRPQEPKKVPKSMKNESKMYEIMSFLGCFQMKCKHVLEEKTLSK